MTNSVEKIDKTAIKEQSSEDAILSLKKQIADTYVEKLKIQKEGGLSSLLIGEGDALKDYLVSEGFGDKIEDAIKGNLMEKLFAGVDKTIFDELKVMKEKIATANTEDQLKILETEIGGRKIESQKVDNTSGVLAATEILPGSKKDQLLKKIDEILTYDSSHPVKYTWGGRNTLTQGLDCSGLLIYAFHQIGLQSPGEDSRDIFTHLTTEKLVLDDNKIENISLVKPGDALFWNTTNPEYDWKETSIPKIKKDGNDYRIHHVAFVKSVDQSSGKVIIVESNGKEGVTEREIDYAHELKETKHKSELYVGHIDYNELLAYNGSKDTTLV